MIRSPRCRRRRHDRSALTAGQRGRRVLLLGSRRTKPAQEDPPSPVAAGATSPYRHRARPLSLDQPAFRQIGARAAIRRRTSSTWSIATASNGTKNALGAAVLPSGSAKRDRRDAARRMRCRGNVTIGLGRSGWRGRSCRRPVPGHLWQPPPPRASLVIATGGPSITKMGATGLRLRSRPPFRPQGGRGCARRWCPSPWAARKPCSARSPASRQRSSRAAGKAAFRQAALFTHKGLSGPAILQISSCCAPPWRIDRDRFPARSRPPGWPRPVSAPTRARRSASCFRDAPPRARLAGDSC